MSAGTEGANGAVTTPTPGQSSGGWRLSGAAREVRLGLVVYGGVSLAIYINGVAEELFRAVRGRGVYKLLKRLLDSDIVVDIISGTSAGGINGLFLAFALTNEREFSDCAQLWRDQGSLSKLLRLIDDEANATSLLDSKNYYVPQLERALRAMGPIAGTISRAERPSRFHELDLFVTGTDFDGRLSTAIDATGRQIEVKTHRTVFHLKHRHGRKTPFAFELSPERRTDADRARVAALARLAAITSCFPAAFEPVQVADGAPGTHAHDVYEHLREWGSLSGNAWFLDGGVLDNKPFSYTIQQIFNRSASRPVDRKLFYVEPDPERFNLAALAARAHPPNLVQSAVQALLGIPGYESIAEDLKQIAQRNDRLERLGRARAAAERAFLELREEGTRDVPASVERIYRHTRLTQLSSRAMKGLMANEGFDRPLRDSGGRPSVHDREREQRRRDAAAALARAFSEWEGNGATQTLERYDVYFKRRRVFHLAYTLLNRVSHLCDATRSGPAEIRGAQALKALWEQFNAQLDTYEIVQWAMEAALESHALPQAAADMTISAGAVWADLAADLDRILAVDPALEPAFAATAFSDRERTLLHGLLKTRLQALRTEPARAAAAPPTAPNLLQRLDAQTAALLAGVAEQHPEVASAWRDFEWYDAHFFPIDYFGDLAEKDPIEVVRVSPIDAERAFSNRAFEDKITGETVMHFGAFLKKSWRSNDIMWGRLDGACRLLDALLTTDALARAVANAEVRALLRDDLAGELHPKSLFPNAGDEIHRQVHRWLADLTSEDAAVRERALQDRDGYDLLLWCAQLEVLHENLPTVLEDATSEQLEWNSVRAERGFRRSGLRIDRATGRLIGKQVTNEFIKGLQGDRSAFTAVRDAPIAKYFLREYSVGAESIKEDIPPAVLLETITAASLVARNCLLNAFPAQGARLRSNLMYKALVHWPMMTAHLLAVLARRERTLYLGVLAALFTYAIVALVGAGLWFEFDSSGSWSQPSVFFLIVLPLVILVAGGYTAWLNLMRNADRRWSVTALRVAVAVLTTTALAPIVLAFIAAWQATNDKLRDWLAAGLASDAAGWLLPAASRNRLDQILDGEAARRVTLYPLLILVVIVMFVAPALRGFVQTRVARRAVGVTVEERMKAWLLRVRGRVLPRQAH